MTAERSQKLREIVTLALVSIAHFWSHFYVLAIPSALPLIRDEFGVSNLAMGAVIAAYSLTSAAWQFPAGIVSDKYGAPKFMIAGIFLISLAAFCQSMAPILPVMVAIAALGGTSDSIFHPADYTIITAKVRPQWLGKSYAIHTFTGFLGFAAAPTTMSFLLAHGTWRWAMSCVGLAGLATAVVLFLCRKMFYGETYKPQRAAGSAQGAQSTLQFLLTPALLLMFLFYVSATLAGNGIQSFSNSALIAIYGISLPEANGALATYLWGNTLGVLCGGLVADRMGRLDRVATVCFFAAALLLGLVGMSVVPFFGAIGVLFLAGFLIGAVMPARDLAVRAVAPAGSIGRAFGYVSSGFGVAGVIGPMFYGHVMDLGEPQLVFYVSGSFMIVTIGVALAASQAARRAVAANTRAAAQPAE